MRRKAKATGGASPLVHAERAGSRGASDAAAGVPDVDALPELMRRREVSYGRARGRA
jgi:hypothetical protein